MSGLTSDPRLHDTFDRIVTCVTRRGSGVLMTELRDAHALARELCSPDTDVDVVAELVEDLGLTEDDVDSLTPPEAA